MIDTDLERLEQLVGAVSRETFDRLKAYQALLMKWSGRVNLIGRSTADDIWTRHILDSAQLTELAPDAERWADIGSGAGLPGLVIAVILSERSPVAAVHLIESNRKKAVFLQIAAGELGLRNVTVHAERIEKVLTSLRPAVITARAVAPLGDLLGIVAPTLNGSTRALFHKGRDYVSEIAATDSGWRYDMVEHPNKVLPDGVILEISNLRPRPNSG